MSAITIMNEDEIQRTESVSSEAGFGCIQTPLGNLPVRALELGTKITGLTYEARVRQTYVNRYDRPLEATYIFPLPDRGAVSDFKMIVGGREIDGVLKERGEARREYQQAIEAGHRASIVEEERPDTFTMRVGNVEVGEEITIEFVVTGPLVFADGEATFRFPLVVAPRYMPGTPLSGGNVGDGVAVDTDAVPDASRISPPVLLPGFPNPIALSIDCELHEGDLNVRGVRSSLHAITLSQGNGVHHVAIKPGERVNRDFILRFDVGEDTVQSGATFTRDAEGDEGTFMLTLVPPAVAQGAESPRDIVFVLDRSGSMDGWKMVAARRAIGRMLDTLTPKDRFQIIVFDNSSTKFGADLIDGSNRNRYRAIEDLSKVEARGGTEMASPIFEGLDMLAGGYEDRRRMLVLVTDGQVGNEQQIVAGVQERAKNVRFFSVGVDQAVNAGFLNRLAEVGGGRCELVESEDRLDDAMDRIHRTIDTPVLTELSVTVDGVTALSNMFVPERMPDLFAGAPLQVMGRYRGDGTPVIKATAAQRDGSKWEATVKSRETGSRASTAIWARQKVRGLEDSYAKSPSGSLSTEITRLSLRFGVLCRFTSWVAVDRAAKIESKGDLHQVVQAVEQPAGWEMNKGMASAPMRKRKMAPSKPMSLQQAPAPPSPSAVAPPMQSPSPRGGFGAPPAPKGGGGPGSFGSGSQPEAIASALYEEEADMAAPMDDMDFDGAGEAFAQEAKLSFEEAPEPVRLGQAAAPSGAPRQQKQERTQAGVIKANTAYMSPEQARGEAIDFRTDVFLLGVLGFQMLTGRKLFSAINDFETLKSVVEWQPVLLHKEAEITGHWLAILEKALAANPADRYVNARELLTDLESRFGEGVMESNASWARGEDATLAVVLQAGKLSTMEAVMVFAWLTAAVAHLQDGTGAAVGQLTPWDVNVQGGTGKAHVVGHNGPAFFDKLKRWLGLEDETSRRDEFWR